MRDAGGVPHSNNENELEEQPMTDPTLPTIPIERLALLDNAVLDRGIARSTKEGNCARELIHLDRDG